VCFLSHRCAFKRVCCYSVYTEMHTFGFYVYTRSSYIYVPFFSTPLLADLSVFTVYTRVFVQRCLIMCPFVCVFVHVLVCFCVETCEIVCDLGARVCPHVLLCVHFFEHVYVFLILHVWLTKYVCFLDRTRGFYTSHLFVYIFVCMPW
jgi:hypothetical protein